MSENTFKDNVLLKFCIIFALIGTFKILMDYGFLNITHLELRNVQIGLMYFYGMVFLIYISFHKKYKKIGVFLCVFLTLHIVQYLYAKTGWEKYKLDTVYGDTFIIKEQCDFGFPSKTYDYYIYDKKSKKLLGKINSEEKLTISQDKIHARINNCKNLKFDEKVKYIYTIDKAITITKNIHNELEMYPEGYE